MKVCHVCMAECPDDAELCAVCGAELKTEEQIAAEKGEVKTIKNPVLAASVEDVVTAEIYRDVLSENGIPFSCDEAEQDGSMKVLFGGGFVAEDIYVDESDLAVAEKLYEEVLNSASSFDDFDDDFEEFEE